MREVTCQYCQRPAQLVPGKVIYPSNLAMRGLWFWRCVPCRAYVGTHANTLDHAPLGTLANATLRAARVALHKRFDPLWQGGGMTRREAYALLAERMGIGADACHISRFTLAQCHQARGALEEYSKNMLPGMPDIRHTNSRRD